MNRFISPDTYAVWTKDPDVRFESTSGGAFTEFAKFILSQGGVVIGAAYNNRNTVEHIAIEHIDDLSKIRQSKYISSSLGSIYKQTRDYLKQGRLVGFCGAPCQIAGLYSFLNKEYENLFTMDFICRGMNSPKALVSWLKEIEEQENKKVKRVWFKYKVGGWKTSPRRTRLDFNDGSFKVYSAEQNLFMHAYLNSNLYIRPSCCNCRFKGVPRDSDVTFADFWGIEKKYDDDKGTSLLLVNSAKGQQYFEKIKDDFNVYPKSFDSIVKGNPMFFGSAKLPGDAHNFLKDLDVMSFSSALKKYGGYPVKISLGRRILRKIKRIALKFL